MVSVRAMCVMVSVGDVFDGERGGGDVMVRVGVM